MARRASEPSRGFLGRNLGFVADFDHEVAATEAWGGRYPLGGSLPMPVDGGKSGKGASIETPLVFSTRHHVSGAEGSVSLDVRAKDSTDGTLITVGGLALKVGKGVLSLNGATNTGRAEVSDGEWHSVTLTWSGKSVWVSCDGKLALLAKMNATLSLPGMGHGIEIRNHRDGTEPAVVTFGPMRAIIDNLRMSASSPQPISSPMAALLASR